MMFAQSTEVDKKVNLYIFRLNGDEGLAPSTKKLVEDNIRWPYPV